MYTARFEPDREAGGFVVTFPEFPGATQGENEEEAITNATDALLTIIGHLIRNEEALPEPRVHRGSRYRVIKLPTLQECKVRLYLEWKKSSIRKAELAKRMGISRTNIDRLFLLNHQSKLSLIDAAMQALGKRFRLSSEAA